VSSNYEFIHTVVTTNFFEMQNKRILYWDRFKWWHLWCKRPNAKCTRKPQIAHQNL